VDISNLSQQRESITKIVDLAFTALFAVSCVAIIVCSLSVATSVNTAIIQSKHDIGIKLSLGAKKSEIMTEFLLYSLTACLIGILTGTATGYLILKVINFIFDKIYTFDFSLLISGISATILLTIIFSLYPSWQAASLLPVKALSRE
jgi:ABC-type antimicrobial peptide transport system permease subunit